MARTHRALRPVAGLWRRLRAGGATSIVFGGLLLVWLAVFFCTAPIHRTAKLGSYQRIIARGDGHYMYLATISLALDHDLDLTNQYASFGDPFHLGRKRTVTGRHWIYPIGTSLMQLPAFLLAQGGAEVADHLGAHIPLHGYTLWHQRVTFLSALLAGFFALVLGYRLARRYVSRTAALYAVAIVGLGSNLYFYSVYFEHYAHAWSALTVALFVEYWDRSRGRRDLRRYAILGAYCGLAALARMQNAVVALLLVGETAIAFAGLLRRRDIVAALRLVAAGALAAVCAIVAACPQLIVTHIFFGSVFAVPQGKEFMRWSAPFLWHVLYSTRNGLFVWTPLVYFACLGLFVAPRPARPLAGALAVVFFAELWVSGSAWSWWGDFSFSARRMVCTAVAWVAGAAFAVECLRKLHRRFPRLLPHLGFAVVLAPLIAFNIELSHAVDKNKQRVGNVVEPVGLYGRSARRIEKVIGDPLSWPYNWLWALRHHATIRHFNPIVGAERLRVSPSLYRRRGIHFKNRVTMSPNALRVYGDGPWGKSHGGAAWARSGARLLLPLVVGDHVRFTLHGTRWGSAPVTFTLNGGYKVTVPYAPSHGDVTFTPPPGVLHSGTNDLAIHCRGAARPGCVEVNTVTFVYAP